ncbi:MAG TPA: hypothetical protein VGI60_01735 [Chthoniobacterales bacterium]|jgi:hypothetical protein
MSDDSMATFGNTTKGGHRGPSEIKFECPNQACRLYITKYPCPHCGYEPGMLDVEAAQAEPPWASLWDIIDGEAILRFTFRCDGCGGEVKRFRLPEYAKDFFRFRPQWCQQCQDKNARK